MAKIFGSEVEFSIVVDDKDIVKTCKDIWYNPEKYSDYKKDTDTVYYEFLKFLWVKYDNGEIRRLADIVFDKL